MKITPVDEELELLQKQAPAHWTNLQIHRIPKECISSVTWRSRLLGIPVHSIYALIPILTMTLILPKDGSPWFIRAFVFILSAALIFFVGIIRFFSTYHLVHKAHAAIKVITADQGIGFVCSGLIPLWIALENIKNITLGKYGFAINGPSRYDRIPVVREIENYEAIYYQFAYQVPVKQKSRWYLRGFLAVLADQTESLLLWVLFFSTLCISSVDYFYSVLVAMVFLLLIRIYRVWRYPYSPQKGNIGYSILYTLMVMIYIVSALWLRT